MTPAMTALLVATLVAPARPQSAPAPIDVVLMVDVSHSLTFGFWSRERGYHGVTVLSAGLTGLSNLHDGFDLPLPMIRHARAPHRLWEAAEGMSDDEFVRFLADDLEQLILREGPETVAAFIAEPLQAAGGVLVPPPSDQAA